MTITKRLLVLAMAFLLIAGLFAGCASVEREMTEPEDFNRSDVKIGCITGSSCEPLIRNTFPEAQRVYASTLADLLIYLEQGKIDAIVEERPFCLAALWEGAPITVMEHPLNTVNSGMAFAKDDESAVYHAQFNEMLASMERDGSLDALREKWFGDAEPEEHPDYSDLPATNGTLRVAVVLDGKPFSYMKNGKFTGFEMDLLTRFARERGYGLNMEAVAFDASLVGLSVEKYNMAVAGFTITEERKKSVLFSESHVSSYSAICVLDEEAVGDEGFFDSVAEGFTRTFIDEARWKLFLSGTLLTILISVCSVVGGSALGFGAYLLSRSERKAVRKTTIFIEKILSRILSGTPVVVVLMILFFVVFGSFKDISPALVSVIGFCLLFATFVFDHMTLTIGNIDRGQTEAALALGYPTKKLFYRILLPQAMPLFLPTFCAEVVSLIKSTAIVGYIAVNDLTKISDIVRSSTYEAFFPLIASAVIYFLVTWLAASALGRLSKRIDPFSRSKKRILKGVEEQ